MVTDPGGLAEGLVLPYRPKHCGYASVEGAMPRLNLTYDLVSPPSLVSDVSQQYTGCVDQCAWADANGFHTVSLPEHHGTVEGYLPSPLVLAGAIAARTSSLRIRTTAIVLPLHDPLRVAEDTAVVDLLSHGRLDVVVAAGYRREEFEMLGVDFGRRGELLEVGIHAMRKAWTGEPFEHLCRKVLVRPRPFQRPGPPILIGGGTKIAARRAARIADGFIPVAGLANSAQIYAEYEDERRRLNLEPASPPTPRGPYVYVADDPDSAWVELIPHLSYVSSMMNAWFQEANTSFRSWPPMPDAASVRANSVFRVVTPSQCVEVARRLGIEGVLSFHPLVGGLAVELGWRSLELFGRRVLPQLEAEGLLPAD